MQLAGHVERLGSRLGRMGEQRNVGLLEDCEEGRDCLCRVAQSMKFIGGGKR